MVETAAHRLHRREHSIAPNFVDHLANEVGPRLSFLNQVLAGELRRCAFGSGRDQRRPDTHEHATRQQLRRRDLGDRDLARTGLLQNLFHAVADCDRMGRLLTLLGTRP